MHIVKHIELTYTFICAFSDSPLPFYTSAYLAAIKVCDRHSPANLMSVKHSQFHSSDYVDFLKRVTPDNEKKYQTQLQKCDFLICVVVVVAYYYCCLLYFIRYNVCLHLPFNCSLDRRTNRLSYF